MEHDVRPRGLREGHSRARARRRDPCANAWTALGARHGCAARRAQPGMPRADRPGTWPLTHAESRVQMFAKWWDVESRDDLLATLDLLESEGDGARVPSSATLLAWHLCRAAALSGYAVGCNWLTREEAWTRMLRYAVTIRAKLGSWNEVAKSYAAGLATMGARDSSFLQRLASNPASPFRLRGMSPRARSRRRFPPPSASGSRRWITRSGTRSSVITIRCIRSRSISNRASTRSTSMCIGRSSSAERLAPTVVQGFRDERPAAEIGVGAGLLYLTSSIVGPRRRPPCVYAAFVEATDCRFEASAQGVDLENGAAALVRCVFAGNSRGLRIDEASIATADGCTFHGEDGVSVLDGSLRIRDCRVNAEDRAVRMFDGRCRIESSELAATKWAALCFSGGQLRVEGSRLSSSRHEVVLVLPDKHNPPDGDRDAPDVHLKGCTLAPPSIGSSSSRTVGSGPSSASSERRADMQSARLASMALSSCELARVTSACSSRTRGARSG